VTQPYPSRVTAFYTVYRFRIVRRRFVRVGVPIPFLHSKRVAVGVARGLTDDLGFDGAGYATYTDGKLVGNEDYLNNQAWRKLQTRPLTNNKTRARVRTSTKRRSARK